MRSLWLLIVGMLLGLAVVAGTAVVYVRTTGLQSRGAARPTEAAVARAARRLAIPAAARTRTNPVAASKDAVSEGMAHFADHCAICHDNDGGGATEMGRGFYPPVPDMRLSATQQLSDGELFYIIENGIRFTGMPAWGTGTQGAEESTWRLVRFIRHLPHLSPDELDAMKALNPRSPEEIRQEIEEERFLNEGAAP